MLTDFEELSIYDCRVKPNSRDQANVARLHYIEYTDYAERWDEIAEVFSREAVLAGSLLRFAQEEKAPKGALPVDVSFLKDIASWREELARVIAGFNDNLTIRELNYAVQMILDRIIFLRIAEDRGIEPYGRLQTLEAKGNLYQNLVKVFRDADAKYNSGLFYFTPERGRVEQLDQLIVLH